MTKVAERPTNMRFWDTSALLPLFVKEPSQERLLGLLEEDGQVITWWGASIEIASAFARREREKLITADEVNAALEAVRAFADSWNEVVPSDAIRRSAERLLRVHPLRAADSLQLAAALVASDHDPTSLSLVCLDELLTAAARREGFTVMGA